MSEIEPRFQPIDMLPVVAELIDGYINDAITLLPDLRQVRERPHVFDAATEESSRNRRRLLRLRQ
jgi:hypothetical protein